MKTDISEHKYLFHQGKDYRSYEFLGAHIVGSGDPGAGGHPEEGVVFRVWAPNAKAISVVGNFNDWDPSKDPMHRLEDDPQIWEVAIQEARAGDLYKFAITSADRNNGPAGEQTVWKADPYAFFSENGNADTGSHRASIVYDRAPYEWQDQDWMKSRSQGDPLKKPLNIYEVHVGSWRRNEDGSTMTYRQTADELIPYVKEMGYTHIELMPIMEYPFDGSWGYQATGYFSPTSRYGRPEDLKYLIDKAHGAGIGVIMDWVPAHFPKDEHGLAEFDGSPLFEYSDPLKAEHKGWGTKAFDLGRGEVISFLISNAFYYCEVFHIDGIRVDAVSAMIYLNYGREDGQWTPNDEGGVENKEATAFLRKMNEGLLTNFPGVITVAEESTAWQGITIPPYEGGLGFNFKWNMGWMNDELEYFSADPVYRSGIHGALVFSLDYAWSENFILPISHDEVVHGKKSLLDKMPGDYEDKFRGFRTFMAYMITHPGKKLTFMGTEFAQFIEWNENAGLDWLLLDYDRHREAQSFIRDLNRIYLDTPTLWSGDDVPDGFRWIDGGNVDDNVITFLRYNTGESSPTDKGNGTGDPLLVALNLSGKDIEGYRVGVPDSREWVPVIDTDSEKYGGSGKRSASSYEVEADGWNGYEKSIVLSLPAMSAIILREGG